MGPAIEPHAPVGAHVHPLRPDNGGSDESCAKIPAQRFSGAGGMTGPSANWNQGRLFLVLYPFVSAAVAVNLFMLGLCMQWLNAPSLSPVAAIAVSLPLGLPATWLTAREI